MKNKADGVRRKTGAETREDRLKAALKKNIERRKAQARARKVADPEPDTTQGQ